MLQKYVLFQQRANFLKQKKRKRKKGKKKMWDAGNKLLSTDKTRSGVGVTALPWGSKTHSPEQSQRNVSHTGKFIQGHYLNYTYMVIVM